MAWDDAKKAKAVEMYQEREPTAANSVEIVKELADELEESVNGVRMILTKAGVYIKKEDTPKKAAASGGKAGAAGGTRVSKEDSHNSLIAAIEAHGQNADSEIISKLTGKAAVYFAGVFAAIPAAE